MDILHEGGICKFFCYHCSTFFFLVIELTLGCETWSQKCGCCHIVYERSIKSSESIFTSRARAEAGYFLERFAFPANLIFDEIVMVKQFNLLFGREPADGVMDISMLTVSLSKAISYAGPGATIFTPILGSITAQATSRSIFNAWLLLFPLRLTFQTSSSIQFS